MRLQPLGHLSIRANVKLYKLTFVLDWRKGRDSNPRYRFRYSGFQDRRLQPLGHPSALEPLAYLKYSLTINGLGVNLIKRSHSLKKQTPISGNLSLSSAVQLAKLGKFDRLPSLRALSSAG